MFTSIHAAILNFAVVALGAATLTLAGCAADAAPQTEEDGEEATSTAASALNNGGGGRGLGFTCDDGTCTCSKEIEGDCDRMVINCTGGFDDFDTCMEGWLTTDCSCTYSARKWVRPIVTRPIRGDLVLAP